MAIVIEEEKREINWFTAVSIIFIIGLVGAAAYYLFFISPPSIDVVFPLRIQSLSRLAEIEFDPQKVFAHPIYETLRQNIPPLTVTPITGRSNPFTP